MRVWKPSTGKHVRCSIRSPGARSLPSAARIVRGVIGAENGAQGGKPARTALPIRLAMQTRGYHSRGVRCVMTRGIATAAAKVLAVAAALAGARWALARMRHLAEYG